MNRSKKILYAFSASLLGVLLLTLLLRNELGQRIALAVVAALSCVLATVLIKKRSILKIEKWQVAWFLPAIAVIAIAAYYLLGLSFGYMAQTLRPHAIWTHVLPMAVIVFCSERTREILLAQKNKWISALAFVIFAVMDVIILQEGSIADYSRDYIDFFGLVLFPAITANVLYHFVSVRYGAMPVSVYRLLMACYALAIPLKPAVPTALFAFLRLMLPLAVFVFLRKLYERTRTVVQKKKYYSGVASIAAVLLLMSLWMMLVSCHFTYGLLVIATDSMEGSIDRGDAIVFKQYEGEPIPVDQVVVFEKNGVVIIHRVVRVETLNGETRYYTKGDANMAEDSGYITSKDIVGTTDMTLKYIGYPTLWMRDIFSK